MLPLAVLIAALTGSLAVSVEDTVQFEVRQELIEHRLASRYSASSFDVPLYNNFSWQKFTIDVAVGTPPQKFKLMLDSGSADMWVPSPASPACTPHCPPTFDKFKSSTYRETGDIFNATYGLSPDGDALIGPYFNDTVKVGPAVIPNMTLALGNVPHFLYDVGNFGILGLGPPSQEAFVINPSSPKFGKFNETYPVLYERLLQAGYIKKRVFGLWLNSKLAKTGSLLFGGIDRTKFTGNIQYVPLVEGRFTSWMINLNSVTFGSKKQAKSILSNPIKTVVDSGSPNMYLPFEVADTFAKSLNATMVNGLNGPFPYVDCNAGKDQYLEFGFNADAKIRVRASDIIYPFGDPANVGEIRDPKGKKLCYVGLQGTPGPIFLLGATFLRSAYTVYDVDGLRMGFAAAKY